MTGSGAQAMVRCTLPHINNRVRPASSLRHGFG